MMTIDDHIFVTGGTGFVGSYILRMLYARGYRHLYAIKRKDSRMGLVMAIESHVHWFDGDLFDYDRLVRQLDGIDVVIHSAAMISFRQRDLKEMRRVNVDATALLTEVALEAGVRQFILISSVAALGRSPGREIIHESCRFEHTRLDTGYGLTKHLAELEVYRAMQEGLQAAIINPAMIMGSGYWDTGTARLIDTVYKRLRFYPLGASGFVDVRDVAEMTIVMLEKGFHGGQLICSAESMPIRDMIGLICRYLERTEPSIALSPTLRAMAWRAEALRSLLTGQPPQITRETLMTSSHTFTFDQSKSLVELGFQYRSLDQCIRDTAAQYLESQSSGAAYDVLPV